MDIVGYCHLNCLIIHYICLSLIHHPCMKCLLQVLLILTLIEQVDASRDGVIDKCSSDDVMVELEWDKVNSCIPP